MIAYFHEVKSNTLRKIKILRMVKRGDYVEYIVENHHYPVESSRIMFGTEEQAQDYNRLLAEQRQINDRYNAESRDMYNRLQESGIECLTEYHYLRMTTLERAIQRCADAEERLHAASSSSAAFFSGQFDAAMREHKAACDDLADERERLAQLMGPDGLPILEKEQP